MRKYHEKEKPVDRICETCGKQFRVWASLLRHGKAGRWCSKECYLTSCRVTVICDSCKKEFTRSKCFAGRYNGKNYCSRACTNEGRKSNKPKSLKAKRYGSKAWQRLRIEIIERDGFCQICGDAMANSVHHKNWDPYDNRLENLVLLCVPCHGHFKRYEDWDTGRMRIVAYSELHSNVQSSAEMPEPVSVN